jgi:hypothetical protein
MLYRMNAALKATTAAPRVVDAHSLLHLQASKAAKACDAADACDGLIILQNPTLRVAATAWGVSLGSVARARRLPPEERDRVRYGKRPLVVPPAVPPKPTPASAAAMAAELVDLVGIDSAFDLLLAANGG